jgi:hypothetical protein
MTELIVTSKDELQKMLSNIVIDALKYINTGTVEPGSEERLNQKQAAIYLGITQSTLIRWKKNGLVPCEQLPGSTKVTYYKSQLKTIIQRNPGLLQAARK